MNVKTIVESPIFTVVKPYDDDDFQLFVSDLKNAEVGKEWVTQNQDRYPNRTCTWKESFTVVYKNNHGVAVLYRCEEAGDGYNYYQKEKVELVWVELH